MNLDLQSSRKLLWPTLIGALLLAVAALALFAAIGAGSDGEPSHDGAPGGEEDGGEGYGAEGAAALVAPGSVLLFRHALTDRSTADADPSARGGCDVQRNLSEDGVAQAERIGESLSTLPVGPVYASPFCRTVDTAEAFGVGAVEPTDALISTTSGLDAAAQQQIVDRGLGLVTTELGGDDVAVLVSHTQNIEAMTGELVDEGDAVVLVQGTDGRPVGVERVIRAADW